MFPSIGAAIFHISGDMSDNTIEGERSLPSMLGGGDLDGDIYCVTQYQPLMDVISWTPAELVCHAPILT